LVRVGTTGVAGVTVIEVNLAVLTVSVADPLTFWYEAVICVVPMLTAVAKPVLLIRATFAAEDVHWTCDVRSCEVPSLKTAVAVNCCVPAIPIVGSAGVTVIEVGTPSVTVKAAEAERPSYVASIVA
jgi:hypothetical protein